MFGEKRKQRKGIGSVYGYNWIRIAGEASPPMTYKQRCEGGEKGNHLDI